MSIADQTPVFEPLFPDIGRSLAPTVAVAGVAAVIAWEIWARGVTPYLVGGPLEPAGLVQAVFGLSSRPLAELIHLIVGLIAYPLGYLFVARPLQRALFPRMPVFLTGIGFGVGLWIFAMYGMAHLAAGFPPFLGFIPLTWASLAGHVIFGMVVALAVHRMETRTA